MCVLGIMRDAAHTRVDRRGGASAGDTRALSCPLVSLSATGTTLALMPESILGSISSSADMASYRLKESPQTMAPKSISEDA